VKIQYLYIKHGGTQVISYLNPMKLLRLTMEGVPCFTPLFGAECETNCFCIVFLVYSASSRALRVAANLSFRSQVVFSSEAKSDLSSSYWPLRTARSSLDLVRAYSTR
jgi:hypothetical protein